MKQWPSPKADAYSVGAAAWVVKRTACSAVPSDRAAVSLKEGSSPARRCAAITRPAARSAAPRVSFQAFIEQEQKKEFGIRAAFQSVVEVVGEAGLEGAADLLETADLAVVHEGPTAEREGMAVGPARRAAGRGAHMGEEQAGPDLPHRLFRFGSDHAGRMSR